MRLAVSNIAWPPEADAEAATLLGECGVTAVEVTPARISGGVVSRDVHRVAAYRRFWEDRGLTIVAMQALLFGRSDLVLFGDRMTRRKMLDYLSIVMDLAAAVGATKLVFGAPRNRSRGMRDREQAESLAERFFRQLARQATDRGIYLLIEPNPPAYGCDFLVDARETIAFVDRVNEEGLGVHLDAGALRLAGEEPQHATCSAGRRLRHFHASEPGLAPIGTGGVDHVAIAAALRYAGYQGHVSIEMLHAVDGDSWQNRLRKAIALTGHAYGVPSDSSAAAA